MRLIGGNHRLQRKSAAGFDYQRSTRSGACSPCKRETNCCSRDPAAACEY